VCALKSRPLAGSLLLEVAEKVRECVCETVRVSMRSN